MVRALSPPPPAAEPGWLGGLRVLDEADPSGAFCATLLAALGADVRRAAPGAAAAFDAVDAVILTGTPAALSRRGRDPAALLARHPRLIVAVISPFGLDGPRAEWRSCDTVAQAAGGMVWVNGHADGPPLRGLGPQAYQCAGLHAALGVVLARQARRRGAAGQLVDVSLQESVAAALEHVSGLFDERGEVAARQGTLHWSGAFRAAACRDGLVLLSHLGDWTALLEWVKSDGAAADLAEPGWADEARRRAECAHVFDVLAAWAARYRVADLLEQAALRRLPFAPIWPLAEVARHPQLAARGFWSEAGSLGVWRAALRVGRRSVAGARLDPPSCPSPARGEGTLEAAPGPHRDAPVARSPLSPLPAPDSRPAPSHLASPDSRLEIKNAQRLAESAQRLTENAQRLTENAQRPTENAQRLTESAQRPLHGLRILDLTWVVAGPLATRVLADHGAEVIKLERHDAPDGGRAGALFGNLNRGKQSIAIDLADRRGAALARRLAARCDVVVDNFSPRVMAQFGLDAAALRAINPDVLSVSLSAFGADGPWADRVGYGPTVQAQTGFTWHMRPAGGLPAGWGFAYADMASGYAAALAVLAALQARGRGGRLDLAQLEIAAALVGPGLGAARAGAAVDDAAGNLAPEAGAAPHGIYRCRDRAGDGLAAQRWVAIAVLDDPGWQGCAAAIGEPWARSPAFASAAGRLQQAAALDRPLAAWTRPRRAEAVVEALQAAGVAAAVVADAADLRRDAQLAARGYWRAGPGGVTLDGVVPRLLRTPGAIAAAAPRRGQHTAQVLRDLLGMEQSAVDRLRRDGVIG